MRYENLFKYISEVLAGRYDINDDLFKIKLIKYLSFYISNAEAIDDYIISLGDVDNLVCNGEYINKRVKLLGLGGVGGNILTYILISGIHFQSLEVYEDDDEYVELHNAIRYFIFNPHGMIKKIDLFKKLATILGRNDVMFINKKYIASESDRDYVIVGAPDIKTRAEIVKLGLKYIFLLHQDDKFYIFTNLSNRYSKYSLSGVPVFEEYGRIKLSVFFSELINKIKSIVEVMRQ